MLSDRPAYANLDRDLRFVAANDRLLNIIGKEREEVIGKRYWEIIPEAEGKALHMLMLEAESSMRSLKRRVWSDPLQTWLDVELYPMSDGMQVAFTPVEGPPPL